MADLEKRLLLVLDDNQFISAMKAANKEVDELDGGFDTLITTQKKNNDQIKENVKEVEKSEKAYSSWKDSILKSVGDIKVFGISLNDLNSKYDAQKKKLAALTTQMGLTSGGVNKLSKAFKLLKIAIASTGVGLLVVALGSLVAFLKTSERGMNVFEKQLNRVKAVTSLLVSKLAELGEAIFDNLTSEKQQRKLWSVSNIFVNIGRIGTKVFPKLASQIKEAVIQADAFTEASIQLKIATGKITLEIEKSKTKIAELNKESQNTNLSFDKRIELATEAGRLTELNLRKEIKLNEDKIKAEKLGRVLSPVKESELLNKLLSEREVLIRRSLSTSTTIQNRLNQLQKDRLLQLQKEKDALDAIEISIREAYGSLDDLDQRNEFLNGFKELQKVLKDSGLPEFGVLVEDVDLKMKGVGETTLNVGDGIKEPFSKLITAFTELKDNGGLDFIKDELNGFIDLVFELNQAEIDSIQRVIDKREENLNHLYDKLSREEEAQRLGLNSNVELVKSSIEEEQAFIDKKNEEQLEKKKKLLKAQLALDAIQNTANKAKMIWELAGSSAKFGPIAGAIILAAAITAFETIIKNAIAKKGFYEGTEYDVKTSMGNDHRANVKDGYLIRVDGDEPILTGKQKRKIWAKHGRISTNQMVEKLVNDEDLLTASQFEKLHVVNPESSGLKKILIEKNKTADLEKELKEVNKKLELSNNRLEKIEKYTGTFHLTGNEKITKKGNITIF